MTRATAVLVTPLLALVATSCRTSTPVELDRLAATTKQPNIGIQLETFDDVDFSDGASFPLVQVTAHILSGDMTTLDEMGPGTMPFQRLSVESETALLAAAADEESIKTLAAPRVLVNSGQRSHVLTISQIAYVKDFEVLPVRVTNARRLSVGLQPSSADSDEHIVQPVVGVLSTGFALDLAPTIETTASDRTEVVLRNPRLDLVRLLGSRVCRTEIDSGLGTNTPWQEPVLLVGELHEDIPSTIRMAAGATALLRMQFRVEQACANARALARGGRIEETYRPSEEFASVERSPLEDDCVVLIRCEIIESEDELTSTSPDAEPVG